MEGSLKEMCLEELARAENASKTGNVNDMRIYVTRARSFLHQDESLREVIRNSLRGFQSRGYQIAIEVKFVEAERYLKDGKFIDASRCLEAACNIYPPHADLLQENISDLHMRAAALRTKYSQLLHIS